MAHWHDFNPWADHIVYLASMKEYAECHQGLGEYCQVWHTDGSKTREKMTAKWIIKRALQNAKCRQGTNNPKVDAYILPQPSGHHSLGLRIGPNGPDYLSPSCNHKVAQRFIEKYGAKHG